MNQSPILIHNQGLIVHRLGVQLDALRCAPHDQGLCLWNPSLEADPDRNCARCGWVNRRSKRSMLAHRLGVRLLAPTD
ncbi:hypothetical protein HRbin30_02694 [bacterium HR30]|nr:hypothetical protein HRbin30_02694 [bacterium HR30]